MRVYVKYFKTTYPKVFLPNYEQYVAGIEGGLNTLETNVTQNKFSSAFAKEEVDWCSSALDKCDKAKVRVEKAIEVYFAQGTVNGVKEAQKATPYLQSANTILYECNSVAGLGL